jgi:hypothetical protein
MPHWKLEARDWKLEVGSQRSNLKLTNVSSLQKGTKPNENRGQKPNELSLYPGI